MRRHITLAIAAIAAGVTLALAGAPLAGAQPAPFGATTAPDAVPAASAAAPVAVPAASAAGPVARGVRLDIVKVSGLIDPLNADLLERSLRASVRDGALALIVQLNSTGGTLGATRTGRLVADIRAAPVPVAIWVGGSGRPRAYGDAYAVVRAADFNGAGPGSRVGRSPIDGLQARSLLGDDAVDQRLLNVSSPTLVDFLGDLNGRTLKGTTVAVGAPAGSGGALGAPAGSVGTGAGGRGPGFRKDLTFNFSQLSVIPKLLHTAASPNVAFAMLVIALALVVFEFFTAGVGVGAATAALFGVLASYGLGVLPTRGWAVALVVVSIVAFAVDVQAGAPRVWTGVGVVTFLVGALDLYAGQVVSLWVVVVIGILLFLLMVNGMPGMVRTRFSTPTIGRESMIGELGTALSGVSPEGTVEVRGAPWRARTNRATPIPPGDVIRVVAIDGLLLEVEPEIGGAKEAHH